LDTEPVEVPKNTIKNIKHIFFDLDNTLWDFKKNSREVLLHLFEEHQIEKNLSVGFNEFIDIYENQNAQLWEKYHSQKITKEELRIQRFNNTFLHFGAYEEELSQAWSEKYITLSPYKTHLIEGTLDVLNYLKKNYQLHLITNGFKEVQYIKLHETGLKPHFNQIIISEEHELSKPDIKLFQLAESLSNSKQNECVMIGDNFDTDITGAINAGWKAIYLSTDSTNETHPSIYQIKKLEELKSIF
jgi:putative hydrolase of the HAD superfamily